ncbi:hypothetical protein [Xanthomonas hortorum]|nr:hypothetical protein [Xanthomonas hortorum]MCE4356606.1 hypothetical protein [Xanthomonas hortorum pv. pelargonii]MCM5526648.1 hypothetical protein [Xanthomonas hortorum pv. pelargonii]MCM5538401.1 hypothetical protein [Xanthomonas hortorum pv. pelargonii]MCM5542623.1 hypothetical protein [Xanthomonas hortorum pv. pelargonii]MCM5546483.1 hypothetical protein [Xanthomonas hortorum pv. pelargonii]
MNINLKSCLIFGRWLLAVSALTACTEGSMRSDYKKNDVQPVKVEKLGSTSLNITYHMPAESLFYSPGVDFVTDHGVLRIAIRRCGISDKCDAMAEAVMPIAEPWTRKVTVPYAGGKVLVFYADTEETFTP